MRYQDILDFKIEMEESVANFTILKLILQPLVENALYHGIKNKRSGGVIVVRAKQGNENEILLEVEDNGIGFTPQKLAQLRNELNDESDEIKMESGFGVGNVNKRIRLYYGKPYGLSIRSEYETGTCATLVIPAKREDDSEPDNLSIEESI
jgi:two-component system sensor histidine kinase YesM